MQVSSKPSTNQYIALIRTKPEYIIPAVLEESLSEAKHILAARMHGYDEVYCELGCGSGRHLLEKAKAKPEAFFIGFELRYKRTFRSAEKAEQLGLKNLLILHCNAKSINRILDRKSLNGIFVNFPDPWSDKRRWAKHKMLNKESLQNIHEVLKSKGFIIHKTDHESSFKELLSLIEQNQIYTVSELSYDLYSSEYLTDNIATEFEQLFISQDKKIFYAKFTKSGGES